MLQRAGTTPLQACTRYFQLRYRTNIQGSQVTAKNTPPQIIRTNHIVGFKLRLLMLPSSGEMERSTKVPPRLEVALSMKSTKLMCFLEMYDHTPHTGYVHGMDNTKFNVLSFTRQQKQNWLLKRKIRRWKKTKRRRRLLHEVVYHRQSP
jgi:hypothetical protein